MTCIRWAVILLIVGLTSAASVSICLAGAIVIANRSEQPVRFNVAVPNAQSTTYALESRDLIPFEAANGAVLRFTVDGEPREYAIDANSIYFFYDSPEGLTELEQLGLAQVAATPGTSTIVKPTPLLREEAVIPIKILVDDDQPATRAVWEDRLRRRVAAVSEVLYAHCRVRLEVMAVDTWETSDEILDFQQSLFEFETEVDPAPAALAIGFTSQYHRDMRPDGRLGGTRGPFQSHILIREWTRVVGEPERVEVLLHEVGHYLGAAHSPEHDSVMRPKLGDRQANARAFRIGFDPLNTLALYLVGLELRSAEEIPPFREFSAPIKLQLYRIYSTLAVAMPEDPAPRVNLRHLGPVAVDTSQARQRALNAIVPRGQKSIERERLD